MKSGLLTILVVCLLGLIGNEDLKEEEREQAHYCEMIKAKKWADYKNISEVCKNDY